jgi:mRNA interferase MazF
LPIAGEVLTSHVRSIDTPSRPVSYAGKVPAAEDVRSKPAVLIGLTS